MSIHRFQVGGQAVPAGELVNLALAVRSLGPSRCDEVKRALLWGSPWGARGDCLFRPNTSRPLQIEGLNLASLWLP